MNVEDVTPILNVSSLEKSFAWFEQPDGSTVVLNLNRQPTIENPATGNLQCSPTA